MRKIARTYCIQVVFTVRQDTPAGLTYTYHLKDTRRLASVDEPNSNRGEI